MSNTKYKEWTDHKNGHRYYVTIGNEKVDIKIVTYPERKKIFETTMDIYTYDAFIDYIKG